MSREYPATSAAKIAASRNYSRSPHDLSEASGIGRVDGGFEAGFQNGLEVDVRGSSGGTGRWIKGPWAAMQPAIEIIALR